MVTDRAPSFIVYNVLRKLFRSHCIDGLPPSHSVVTTSGPSFADHRAAENGSYTSYLELSCDSSSVNIHCMLPCAGACSGAWDESAVSDSKTYRASFWMPHSPYLCRRLARAELSYLDTHQTVGRCRVVVNSSDFP